MQKTKRDKSKNTNPLMNAFNYDTHDLQDNQQGFISHRQKTGLKWYLFRNTIWITGGLFLAGLWVFVFALLSFHSWTDADVSIGMKIFAIVGFLFAGSMTILALVGLFEVWRATLYDLRLGNVEKISGTVTKYERRRHKEGTERWLVIQGLRVDIGPNQYKAIDNNKPYHLYRAEKTGRTLAVETAPMSYQDSVPPVAKEKNDAG